MIFINGMGCTETGAKQVLTWFLESYPFEEHVVAIAPFRIESKSDRRITALLLSHQIFGRLLRVPLELIIGLAGFLRFFSLIINLSNYGLCFNRNYVLYIHSPSLLPAKKKKKGWKDGGSNPLKQWMLKSCLRRCGLVVVQTQHMRDDLEGYLHRESITPAGLPPKKWTVQK